MNFIIESYTTFVSALNWLRSPLLLAIRLYWGWQFAQDGWGKLTHLDKVTEFFTSLSLPAPHMTALTVALIEFYGGQINRVGTQATAYPLRDAMYSLNAISSWTDASQDAQNVAWARSTQKGDKVYLHVFDWPEAPTLTVPLKNRVTKAYTLAQPDRPLKIDATDNGGVMLRVPGAAPDPIASVIVLEVEGKPEATP